MHWLRKETRRNVLNKKDVDAYYPNSSKHCDVTSIRSTALELVCQAAEIIKNVDDRAADNRAMAEALAEKAVEALRTAQARARAAEAKQQATEADLKGLIAKVEDMERTIDQAISRAAVAEEQMSAAEKRARTAESALIRIEKALGARSCDETDDLHTDERRVAIAEDVLTEPLPSCVLNRKPPKQRRFPM